MQVLMKCVCYTYIAVTALNLTSFSVIFQGGQLLLPILLSKEIQVSIDDLNNKPLMVSSALSPTVGSFTYTNQLYPTALPSPIVSTLPTIYAYVYIRHQNG